MSAMDPWSPPRQGRVWYIMPVPLAKCAMGSQPVAATRTCAAVRGRAAGLPPTRETSSVLEEKVEHIKDSTEEESASRRRGSSSSRRSSSAAPPALTTRQPSLKPKLSSQSASRLRRASRPASQCSRREPRMTGRRAAVRVPARRPPPTASQEEADAAVTRQPATRSPAPGTPTC